MDNATRILTYVIIFLLFQLAGPPTLSNEQLNAVAKFLGIIRAELDTLGNVTLKDFKKRQLPLSALNFTNIKEYSADRRQQLHPRELELAIQQLWEERDANENSTNYLHPNADISGDISFNASLLGVELPLPVFKNEESPEWKLIKHPVPGFFSLQLEDDDFYEKGDARIITGSASFIPQETKSKGPLPQTDLPVWGVYLSSGRFIVSTSSLKFQGAAVIPYLIGSDDARVAMLNYLNRSSPDSINVYDAWQMLEAQKTRALESAEIVIYGKTRIDDNGVLRRDEIDAIEHELDSPEGAPLPPIPRLISDIVVWSPDSGLNGAAQNASGIRSEVLLVQRRRVLLGLLGIYIALTALLGSASLQLASPSRAGKFSMWTAAAMAVMDGTTCMTQVTSLDNETSQLSMAIALFAFVLTVWFELDLVTRIYSAQANEAALAFVQSQNTIDGQEEHERSGPRPTVEYVGEREISGRVYGRFYLTLFALFVSALMFGHSRTSRYRYEAVVATIFYSYWVPQCWRSTVRGSQVPLSPRMMCAIAGLRLLPLVYLCLDKSNVFGHHYRPSLTAFLVLWQGFQVGLLSLQRRFGSRFFLPRSWTVEGYDYHRLLADDIEQQDTTLDAPRTSGQDSTELEFNETLQSYCRSVSCAICMEGITLPIHRGGPVTPALDSERQNYMITPCRHVFHTGCLEQWMESKLQCPVCRSPLPAI